MTPPNPLGSSARLRSTVRAARLYVLVRDAYLATPAITLRKLAALEELRRGTTDNCDAPPQPDDCSPAELSGVRLVEWLRDVMHERARELGPADAALAMLDVMTSTAPPRQGACAPTGGAADGLDWSADPLALFLDAGGYLAPHLPVTTLTRLYRGHRQTRRLLAGASRLGLAPRAVDAAPGPEDAVADMVVAVLGLSPAAARASAVLLLDGSSLDADSGLAGSVLFDRLDGFAGPDAFVGTTLARTSPVSLVHHLASLETAVRLLPSSRETVAGVLDAVREDVATTRARDEAEGARLRAGRRALDFAALRLGERSVMGSFSPGLLPRPRLWLPNPDQA